MKRILCVIMMLVLCVSLLTLTALAAGASASLAGPNTVRAGDTITVTLNLNGTGLLGASGTLSYDTNQLTLTGISPKVASPWMVEVNGGNFVVYDNLLSNPINSYTSLFAATFQVNPNLATGTAISVYANNIVASDGTADANVGTVAYSTVIAPPLSVDNTLKSLSVSNATISPVFNAGTTFYTAQVPYEVEWLDVSAVANDGAAIVHVNSPALIANGTTEVTVAVTAENGAVKAYTISVKRAQDPNYVPSSDNDLEEITVEGFLLSPAFEVACCDYVIWLPFETEHVNISGTASDSKASVEVVGGENLIAGEDNIIQVICTAENGDKKVYTIIAKRAAAHGETTEEPEVSPPIITETPTPEPTVTVPPASEEAEQVVSIPWWMLVIVGVAGLAVGLGAGCLIERKVLTKKGNSLTK